MVRLSIDTNIVVYAIDDTAPTKQAMAIHILALLLAQPSAISLQVVGEFFHVATRKYRVDPTLASLRARDLVLLYDTFGATPATTLTAIELASSHRLSFWDANLVSAAEAAGCTHLLTEDMHDGLRIGRLEIVHPFAGDDLSPRARHLLDL